MKVLIINTEKDRSSVGKIAYRVLNALNDNGVDACLVYGVGSNDKNEKTYKVSNKFEYFIHHCINAITGYHSAWAPLPMMRIKHLLKEYKPDIVQLYNLHGYYLNIYKLFDILSELRIPIVYGMLDEYPYLGYCAYAYDCEQFKSGCMDCKGIKIRGYLGSWFFNRARKTFLLKQKAYNKNDIIFTGPQWVLNRAESSALLHGKRLIEVDEFVDTENTYIPRETSEFRGNLGISNEKIVILNVAPSSDPRKGVKDFIKYAEKCRNDNVVFVNVGNQENIDTLPKNYIGVPFVADQVVLSFFYSMADLFFCTSHADTMPNTCLEALSCGTPIMGYKITGIPFVAEEPLGKFFDINDEISIMSVIENTVRKDQSMVEICRDYAVDRYSLSKYINIQLGIYNEIMKRK